MGKFGCETCGREFKQKSHYEKHKERKTPCVKIEKLKEIVDKMVDEKLGKSSITIKREPLNPIVKWSGGKKDELKQILPYLPENFTIYLEPFIGGGALYFHLNPEKAVINDVHKELVDLYQSIKDGHSNENIRFYEGTSK